MQKPTTETIFKIIRFKNGINNTKSRIGNFNAYYKAGKYLDYITRSFKNEDTPNLKLHSIYTGEELNVKNLKKQFKFLQNNQTVYDTVVSFSDSQSKNFNLEDPKIISNFISKPFEKLLEENGHCKNNINAFFAIHKDTAHTHIHLGFFEKEALFIDGNGKFCFKKRAMLKNIKQFTKSVDNNFNNLNFASFYQSRIELLNNFERKQPNVKDANFEKLIEHFLSIPKKFSKTYFFNKQPKFVKDATLAIFEKMKKNDDKLKNDYEKYVTLLEEIDKKQKQIYKNSKNKFKFQNLHGAYGIESRIGNKILATVKNEVNKIEKSHHRKIKIYQMTKYQNPKIERNVYFGLKQLIKQLISNDYEKQKWESIQKFKNMQNHFRR